MNEFIENASHRGGSRDTSNNCIGEQNSNYNPRKTKLKEIFTLLHRCPAYLKSASVTYTVYFQLPVIELRGK